jgi:hypothetical protein
MKEKAITAFAHIPAHTAIPAIQRHVKSASALPYKKSLLKKTKFLPP